VRECNLVTIKRNAIKCLLFTIVLMAMVMANCLKVKAVPLSEEEKQKISNVIVEIFNSRNKAILDGDIKIIEGFYDKSTKYATWAFEHEQKKMKYLHNWEEKQGVKFTDIIPTVVIRTIKGSDKKYSINLLCSTEYKYIYKGNPDAVNSSRIGTYHILNLYDKDGTWVITKEWYKDPFADSLSLDNLKVDSIKEFISTQNARDSSELNDRRLKAMEYAEMYCGAASEEKFGFKYNKKYRDYNPQGGDCANFASQILHEGGKFRKNGAWNYDNSGATRAWLNADGFKSYMVNSGRASVIAYGSYEKVFKASYKLQPGDFVAYEKKGDITHISVVSGADSKGYTLVTCHNTDRNKVPWDLGWSDKKIKFWLVRVHF
jgi:hypothetical protein